MNIEALEALRPELEQFTLDLGACIKTRPSRKHLSQYLAGQLSDLPRKSTEPIALMAGIPARTLQQFMSSHHWDAAAMVDCLQRRVAERHGYDNAIALIDETSFPKKGDKTPGVQRQHCGATGKLDNCVVSVHLGYVAGDFHALLDGDIYLPKGWLDDAERCREAGIPEETPYRTKPMMALDLLAAACHRGIGMAWLCADELYGRSHEFRLGVAELGLNYVVEIPSNLTGWLPSRPEDSERRRVDQLWQRGGPPWEPWHVKDMEKGPAVWDVRAVRFQPREEGVAGDEQWLIIARNALKHAEVKYFLCNAPVDAPLGEMLRVAFYRWHIERLFQESKDETGLDHFEGRLHQGWKRHLALTATSVLFLSEQRKRLRRSGEPFTVEQVKLAVEVQLDPEMPKVEVLRQLKKVMTRIAYYQRRNAAARRSHEKTKRRRLAEAGVDMESAQRCPQFL